MGFWQWGLDEGSPSVVEWRGAGSSECFQDVRQAQAHIYSLRRPTIQKARQRDRTRPALGQPKGVRTVARRPGLIFFGRRCASAWGQVAWICTTLRNLKNFFSWGKTFSQSSDLCFTDILLMQGHMPLYLGIILSSYLLWYWSFKGYSPITL